MNEISVRHTNRLSSLPGCHRFILRVSQVSFFLFILGAPQKVMSIRYFMLYACLVVGFGLSKWERWNSVGPLRPSFPAAGPKSIVYWIPLSFHGHPIRSMLMFKKERIPIEYITFHESRVHRWNKRIETNYENNLGLCLLIAGLVSSFFRANEKIWEITFSEKYTYVVRCW